MSEELGDLCRKGLHGMVGDNVGYQASTGRRYCKACRAAYKREKRREENPPTTLCKRGLHDLSFDENVYVTPKGKRSCKPCRKAARKRRKEKVAEPEPVVVEQGTVVSLPPPGGVRSYGGPSGEAAARYRLARMVRASRR